MSFLKLNTNIKPIYAKSLEEFNKYVRKYKTKNQIILTKSNNISQENLRHLPCSRTWKRANHMEFQYIGAVTQIRVIYAIHYDEKSEYENDISYKAITYFKGLLNVIPTDDKEEDIELFNCPENKQSVYYNYIDERYTNMTISNCYSLDRNNSFPASMMEVYPQTKPWVEKYYKERCEKKALYKEGKLSKQEWEQFRIYGSIFVGWLNNPRFYRSKAWKKIISNSNEKVHKLRKAIEANGNKVLLVNTDAVKFIGNFPYKENEDLGGFKYEWKDTKMYIKGIKSYAYLDDNKWKFKQAGKTKLDRLKSRDEWTLEEFKNAETLMVSVIKINEKGELIEVYE